MLNFIKRFNTVSQWTSTNILREVRLKKRGRLMARFVSIALVPSPPPPKLAPCRWFHDRVTINNVALLRCTQECYRVNNFNTALAIISGLNSSAVHRLKFTRAEVPDRLWAVRSPLFSPFPPKASALLELGVG